MNFHFSSWLWHCRTGLRWHARFWPVSGSLVALGATCSPPQPPLPPLPVQFAAPEPSYPRHGRKHKVGEPAGTAFGVAPTARVGAVAEVEPDCVNCGESALKVHFYDVAQGLAVLVDLPDGRHILVDTGDEFHRPGCGEVCERADNHLLADLEHDLHGEPISMIWITHQHSDHLGGAHEVMGKFATRLYVDNGREAEKGEVRRAHDAAHAASAVLAIVDPEHAEVPLRSTENVKLTAIVPSTWPDACEHDANDCSIGLRIDYCQSSVLFTGDAEADEESAMDVHGHVTLLQVGHHGSNTSTSKPFLTKVAPKYAVISAGKPGEGTNRTYCHPRAVTVEALTAQLGGSGSKSINAFDGDVACKKSGPEHWHDVRSSDRLWATERDGDVVLTTKGDGEFTREAAP